MYIFIYFLIGGFTASGILVLFAKEDAKRTAKLEPPDCIVAAIVALLSAIFWPLVILSITYVALYKLLFQQERAKIEANKCL